MTPVDRKSIKLSEKYKIIHFSNYFYFIFFIRKNVHPLQSFHSCSYKFSEGKWCPKCGTIIVISRYIHFCTVLSQYGIIIISIPSAIVFRIRIIYHLLFVPVNFEGMTPDKIGHVAFQSLLHCVLATCITNRILDVYRRWLTLFIRKTIWFSTPFHL